MGFSISGAVVSKVDSLYQNAIDSMTPCEKVARSVGLFNWSREIIWRQIQEANPQASTKKLKLLVALQIYGGDIRMRTLIEGLLENVSD
jgi:hypothetical protein